MEDLINFFVALGKLKFFPRRGWVIRGIKKPETLTDHDFTLVFLTWIFSFDKNLNTKKLLKMALFHSLPAVNLQKITSYDHLLKVRSKKELLRRYPALSLRESVEKKEEVFEKRFQEEKEALESFLKTYPDSFTNEISQLWEDFRLGKSREAEFLSSVDKLENLIQAIIYKDALGSQNVEPFWQQCDEVIHDKDLLAFVTSLHEYYRRGEKSVKDKKHLGIIKFIFEIAKLKIEKRKGWVLRGVKNSDSVASHSVVAAIMATFFSGKERLDQRVMILMLMMHNLFVVRLGDTTPHDIFLEKIKDVSKVIESFPWVGLKHEKEVIMKDALERESSAIDSVLKNLPHKLKHELKYLWLEFRTGTSPEGRFARQVDRIETVIQAMEYHKEDKSISPTSFWLGLKELIDYPRLQQFVENVDHFYFDSKD